MNCPDQSAVLETISPVYERDGLLRRPKKSPRLERSQTGSGDLDTGFRGTPYRCISGRVQLEPTFRDRCRVGSTNRRPPIFESNHRLRFRHGVERLLKR